MIDADVSRSRLVALLTRLQTKRIVTPKGKGFLMLEGYRLPPVMFSREEALALLTAEKLAARFTDTATAQLTGAAVEKLRAVLRHGERDHLGAVNPYIHVFERNGPIIHSAQQKRLSLIQQVKPRTFPTVKLTTGSVSNSIELVLTRI